MNQSTSPSTHPSSPSPALVILYGGSPTEHEISRVSGATIYEAALSRYENIALIGISKTGKWLVPAQPYSKIKNSKTADSETDDTKAQDSEISGSPNSDSSSSGAPSSDSPTLSKALLVSGSQVDPVKYLLKLQTEFGKNLVVFPALHGPKGEDGTLQTQLQDLGIAFVGADAEVSRNCINKLATKKILTKNKIAVTPYTALTYETIDSQDAEQQILEMPEAKFPFVIKPAGLGSSVGVHLIKKATQLKSALSELVKLGAEYDINDFLVEEYIVGREMECSVLEIAFSPNKVPDTNPENAPNDLMAAPETLAPVSKYLVSAPGEIVSSSGIYDYDEKYTTDAAQLIAPAKCSPEMISDFKNLTQKVVEALGIQGLARVDFLLRESDQQIFVNEVNTMPGFTSISMYPHLMQLENIEMEELLDRLVELALNQTGTR